MKCPHCGEIVHESWNQDHALNGFTDRDCTRAYEFEPMTCPACELDIVRMVLGMPRYAGPRDGEFLAGVDQEDEFQEIIVFPRVPRPLELGPAVPLHIAQDLEEAIIVLPYSPKASAALSRRCLQNILVDAGKVTKRDLVEQIEEAVKAHGFTSGLRRLLTAVRMVGNYAAHPLKDKTTGMIVDVEPGEADLNISALEALVDYFYIRPAEEEAQLAEINRKLIAAGKPPIT
ncbi:DUF4145 domain-containing protein [Deinococcus caeni]|uniref:DUF4145 domain-containing protein n=1 Tax=Deinococcus caeni TaxID=569127 RepID=UPI0031EBF3C0